MTSQAPYDVIAHSLGDTWLHNQGGMNFKPHISLKIQGVWMYSINSQINTHKLED